MPKKNQLLSIGDMAKLTGASLRSLRYYEKLGILTPTHIDPDSGYRYYSFDQTHLVEIIMFCIELDIPLKEFVQFSDADGVMDYRAFFKKGREIALQKQKNIERGLKLIDDIGRKMDLTQSYQPGEIYEREITPRYFYTKPCGTSLKDVDLFSLTMSFLDLPFADEEYNDLFDYGFLCEHASDKTQYHAFIEVPKRMTNKQTKKVPGGTYLCRQDENPQIERMDELFGAYLKRDTSYLAVETEIFTGKGKITKPLHEVQVLRL